MSNANNTQILEDLQADFDTFVSQRNWKDAQALVDGMWDTFPHEAMILRKAFIAAQFAYGEIADWLKEYGATEDEIEEDVHGRRFIRVETEEEGGMVHMNRKYLPVELQVYFD